MKFPKELTTVTPISRVLAMLCFITFPLIAFFWGLNYQKNQDQFNAKSVTILYTQKQQPIPSISNKIIYRQEDMRKTYTGEDFTFEYPSSWIKKSLCEENPFCLLITNYKDLPDTEMVDPEYGEIYSKKTFMKEKNDIANYTYKGVGAFWQSSTSNYNWIQVDGIPAAQTKIGYNVEGGIYYIVTIVMTDSQRFAFLVRLPLLTVTNGPTKEKLQALNNGNYDNNVKRVIDDYNRVIFSFKLTRK